MYIYNGSRIQWSESYTADQLSQQQANQPMEINNRVLRLGKIITEAETVLLVVHQPNKPCISPHTQQMAKNKREMKQRRKSSEQTEKEYKPQCNELRKSAKIWQRRMATKTVHDIKKHTGDRRCRGAYRVIKQINRKWKPTQSAIKDKTAICCKEKKKPRNDGRSSACSSLYNNTGNSDRLIAELEQITLPPTEDTTRISFTKR